jgi:5-methylthioadenosine/S-adenosylhomocysteine deaminase
MLDRCGKASDAALVAARRDVGGIKTEDAVGDTVIRNGRIWPGPGQAIRSGESVLVRDGRIAAVGVMEAEAAEVIDAGGALCMPGLIQGHVHLCQTLFRGLAEDLPLLPWLRTYIWPLEAAHDAATLRASALLSVAEMLRTGTTAFQSMETVRHTQVVFEAVAETGIMGIIGHCLMDESGGYDPLAVPITDSLAYCDELHAAWGQHDRVRLGLAPRFALSCTTEHLRTAAEFARDRGLPLHTHASEHLSEVSLVRDRTGRSNIEYLHSVGWTGPDVGLAHCVHTSDRERSLLGETNTRVLHCPSANCKLGSGTAPIPEYVAKGIPISIGADGAPCNNRLDGFLEMRLAALMQQLRLGPGRFGAEDVVRLATEQSAIALNWDHEMGTIEVGKRANLILVDQQALHCLPSDDPATTLVYANTGADVKATMVNGRVLYRDGALLTIDEDRLRGEVAGCRSKLLERSGL